MPRSLFVNTELRRTLFGSGLGGDFGVRLNALGGGSGCGGEADRAAASQPEARRRVAALVLFCLLVPMVAVARPAVVLAVARTTAERGIAAANNDPAWDGATTAELRPEGPAAKGVTTSVAALWNDRALFIRFRCTGVGLAPFGAEHDAPHYKGEVVEVFLRPAAEDAFIELQLSPAGGVLDKWWTLDPPVRCDSAGVLTDAYIRQHEHGNLAWTAVGLRTAVAPWIVRGHPIGWIADLAIPWSAVKCAAPRVGRCMRAHFIRIARPEVGMAASYFSWVKVPLGRPHRAPARMGILKFVAKADVP